MSQAKKRTATIVIIIGLVAAGIISFLAFPRVDRALISEKVELTVILYNGEATGSGSVTVPFTKDSDRYTFANAAVDFNRDGAIAPYAVDERQQEEWIVKNYGVRTRVAEGNNFSFEVIDSAIASSKDLPATVVLTKEELSSWAGSIPSRSAAKKITIPSVLTEDYGNLFIPEPGAYGAGASPLMTNFFPQGVPAPAQPPIQGVTAGPAVGAGAPSFATFHDGMPDNPQGTNECGLSSTANNLTWLARENNWSDRMPPLRDLIEELRSDLQWTDVGIYMSNYIAGKQAFANRHNVPIETHAIHSANFDTNIVSKIATEMAKGQAIELVIDYYAQQADGGWQAIGGHVTAVAGAWTAGENQYLGFHDSLSAGPGQLDIYQINGTNVLNYRYRGDTIAYIRGAYAQSPATSTTATTVAPPQAVPTITEFGQIENEEVQNVWYIEMLVLGGQYFPKRQFRMANPDVCGAPHYHVEGGIAYGLDIGSNAPNHPDQLNPILLERRNAPVVEKIDSNPGSCGFGKVAEVPVAQVMISRQEALSLLPRFVR